MPAMDRFFSKSTKLNSILSIFALVILLSFHFYFIYFINSSYITAFVGEKIVSLIYGIGAIFNITLFLLAPKILRKFGAIKMTLIFTFVEAFAVIVMAFPLHEFLAIIAFLFHMSVATILIYCIDMLLEQYSKLNEVGTMRGLYLTLWNIPPIITPFIAGIILGDSKINLDHLGNIAVQFLHMAGFWKIYIIAAIFLLPFAIILKANFNNFKDPDYPRVNVKESLQNFYKNNNIFDIFADRLLLNLYFAWSVVYLPIYLHEYIGFSWNSIGIILSVMLLPYVLFERLIGKIQDRDHGEKGVLIWGFFLLAISSIILPFIKIPNIYIWITLLFTAHIGAAFVEVSTESYFFKHVSPNNSSYISLFRMTRTIPYIILPPIIALCLAFLPFDDMFLVLGIIMLLGLRYAFKIKEKRHRT